METDPDYRENQARGQRAWLDRNPDYWREYRKARPEYSARNRELQKKRDYRRSDTPLAKMGVSMPAQTLPAGIYHLRPIGDPDFAKMDAWTFKITLLPGGYAEPERIAKR